jgi:diketogulonate reductase-like aldo/keto reductase
MIDSINSTVELNNGVKMPVFGLGVWQVEEGDEVENSVRAAIDHGYKLIDTAAAYRNEVGVGKAIKESNISREDIFVTTKLWNDSHGYDAALKACEDSLKRLQLDYLDLYLIHWPLPMKGKAIETWKALETLYQDKKVRAIGVSNFHVSHLQELLDQTDIVPAVNQLECHPYMSQKELRAFCRENGILFQSWSPLAQGQIFEDAQLKDIADRNGKTVAQVVIRWHLQQGLAVIPKSIKPSRIQENSQVFDFTLSEEDMGLINALNVDKRIGPHPDSFDLE